MTRRLLLILLFLATPWSTAACGTLYPQPAPPTRAVLPDQLLGPWHMVTNHGGAFSYEFSSDGRYLYNGIMKNGSLEYTLQEGGRAAVHDDHITMTPQKSLLTRTDPQDAAQPSRSSWQTPAPRTLTWQVTGDQLTLAGGDGTPSVYQRG